MIEFLDLSYSECIQVKLEEIVAVLVYCNVEGRVYWVRGQCLMIGKAENIVAVAHVIGINDIGIVGALVYAFVYFGMGVQAGSFPAYGSIQVCVRVVYFVTMEG